MIKIGLILGAAFVLNAVIFMIRGNVKDEDSQLLGRKTTIDEVRKIQVGGYKDFSIRRRYEELVQNRVEPKKYTRKEKLISQSGYRISVGELYALSVMISATLFIAMAFLLNNIVLGIVFAVMGFMSPEQFIHFVANKRISQMEKQVGSFIQLTYERYVTHGDMQRAIKETAPDFKERQPLYGEIQKTLLDFEVGVPTIQAMNELGVRTGNKYLLRLSDYYQIATRLGTQDARKRIVGQAYEQFYSNYKMKATLKEQIRGPKNDAYLMASFVPIVMIYQMWSSKDYLDFMLTQTLGKIGLAGIVSVVVLAVVFINKKIAAPLD